MYSLYVIINNVSGSMYLGQTSNTVPRRFYEHKHNAFSLNKKSKLYDAMRSYGEDAFEVQLMEVYATKEQVNAAEVAAIQEAKELGISVYNMTKGGEGGFSVPFENLDSWKVKLSKARVGRKPALGMKHSEENKKLFSEVSSKYWDENRQYTVEDMVNAGSFKKAKELYNISKTHYYRLIKRALPNEQC